MVCLIIPAFLRSFLTTDQIILARMFRSWTDGTPLSRHSIYYSDPSVSFLKSHSSIFITKNILASFVCTFFKSMFLFNNNSLQLIFNLRGDLNSGDSWTTEAGVTERTRLPDHGINSGLMNENNSGREIKIHTFHNYLTILINPVNNVFAFFLTLAYSFFFNPGWFGIDFIKFERLNEKRRYQSLASFCYLKNLTYR